MMGRKGNIMTGYRPLLFVLAAALLIAAPGFGQMAISTKAGLINASDGEVFVDGKLVAPKPTEFITIPKEGLLKTTEGRAEVLLSPGSFLRMADNASFRLMENDLSNVLVDVLEGAVLVEVTELNEDTRITLKAQEQLIRLKKSGIYLVEVTPELRVRVYGAGEAEVAVNDEIFTVKGSRELVASAGGWTVNKFDSKDTDPLYRWAMRRSEYIAMANLSAARTVPRSGSGSYGSMSMWSGMPGGWFLNPYFGTMTYVPFGSNVFSPFGYAFFNPMNAYRFYTMPQPYYNRGGGWQNAGGGGSQGRWSAASGPMVRGGDSGMGSYRGATSGGFGGGGMGGGTMSSGGSVSSSAGAASSGGAAASGGGGGRGGRGQ